MKYFIVLACLAVVAYGLPPAIEEKIKIKISNNSNGCKADMGATDDDIAPLKKHEPPTTEKGKCFLACVSKKFGFLDESGKKDQKSALEQIEKLQPLDEELFNKGKEVLDTCFGEVKDDPNECETALNLYNCAQKEMKAHGIKPLEF